MLENTALVGGEGGVAQGTKAHVEDAGPPLLDVDDVPRREVDQGRRNSLVCGAKAVDEEVRDRRRLGAEVERSRPDRRPRRHARDENEPGGDEPSGAGRGRNDDEQEIGVDGQTRIVSASADALATRP
jgi:hypothetical protein